VINQRHEAVACFLSSENHTTSRALHTHLNGISNVPRFLGRMKSGKAKITDWQGVVKVPGGSSLLSLSLTLYSSVYVPYLYGL
jgi:DNA mismatch repair protein MSH5